MARKIRSNIFLIFLFANCQLPTANCFSQDSIPVVKKSEQSLEFIFDGYVNSNAITNEFIKSYYTGKFLTNEIKSQVSDNLSFENRLGGEMKTGFTYTFHSLEGKNKPAFSFSFFDRKYLSASFSRDLFDVIFYGNKIFEGDTAKLWNSRVNSLHYQQFRFGWKWDGDAAHGSYGFAFSLLSGDQNLFIDGNTQGLFTADDGTYLTLPLRMDVYQSDTAKTKFFSQNGMGLSTDFFYELPYTFMRKPGRITFAVNDLGFIRWNNNSLHYAVDSFYYFSGLTVKDLVHLDSNAFSSSNTNHLMNRNAKIQRGFYSRYIPATLDIHTKTSYGKTFAVEKGFKYYFNTSAYPYFYLKFHFNFGRKQNFHVAYITGYGGFGKFHAGLETYFDLGKKYSVHLADNYLFSGIAQTSYGMGAYAKLVRKF
ncbi:MAG: hypothetical protein HY063_13605 [Bacteroidetes bacterium]|nr:hypothetical protein [Bacteroidota bacterium]